MCSSDLDDIVAKDRRADMLINLEHGKPIVFGDEGQHGVVVEDGEARIVEVAAVGLDRIAVHDEHREDPSLAFALSRLSWGPVMPTPIGIFRDVERAVYEQEVDRQLVAAQSGGPADLDALLGSGTTWDVG